ncbi:MAG: hypothetical protein IJZ63_00005, partial [Clostridia bacterium]|nr:hypothetical protein [Clostridia bacterium]
TTFYGWIVLRRTDLMTTYRYGRELKVLAFGSVTSSGGLTYRTFDGSTLQCTKQSATGRYLITMPSGWFSSASHCTVLLTGVGYSSGSSSALIKASVVSRTTTTVLVGTSDDASANDGAFDFVIINNNDWIV